MQNQIQIVKATNKDILEKVHEIRRIVFVEEQNCAPEIEWEFEEESNHFLALVNNQPVGASRWRKTVNGYKLERFAVLKEYRGKGIGQALVQAVLSDLPIDADYVYLHSQIKAMGLYQKLGFVIVGNQFEEAGIQHYKMVLRK